MMHTFLLPLLNDTKHPSATSTFTLHVHVHVRTYANHQRWKKNMRE